MLTPTLPDPVTSPAKKPEKTPNNDLGQKHIFLRLLVAQMRYQDPLKPQDPTKMSSQLAQFNTLEAQLNANKLLQKILDAQTAGGKNTASPASYLGKIATTPVETLDYTGGTITFDAGIAQDAKQALAVISDTNGIPVRSINLGALTAGTHPVQWDGKTDAGTPAPTGTYKVKVVASDAFGNPVDARAQRSGKVTSVRFANGKTELMIGGRAVDIAKVIEISL